LTTIENSEKPDFSESFTTTSALVSHQENMLRAIIAELQATLLANV